MMTLRSELDDARRKMRDLEDEIQKLKGAKKPYFDVPPRWVILAAHKALDKTSKWNDTYSVLCAYYRVPFVGNYVDEKKAGKNAGVYFSGERAVYGPKGGMDAWVAMHEFAHHLCAYLPVEIDGEPEQALCDAFADEIMKEWNENEP